MSSVVADISDSQGVLLQSSVGAPEAVINFNPLGEASMANNSIDSSAIKSISPRSEDSMISTVSNEKELFGAGNRQLDSTMPVSRIDTTTVTADVVETSASEQLKMDQVVGVSKNTASSSIMVQQPDSVANTFDDFITEMFTNSTDNLTNIKDNISFVLNLF